MSTPDNPVQNPTTNNQTETETNNPASQIKFEDSDIRASYANFCRITGTPEEMIIDFGLNSQPVGVPSTPIVATERVVTNFYTAKRLLFALQATIQRHEQTFGVLEIDVQKRVKIQ